MGKKNGKVVTNIIVPPSTRIGGGTPGHRSPDQWSHPSDATDLVMALAQMHEGMTPQEAQIFVTNCKTTIGEYVKNGTDPMTALYSHCAELALLAHHAQMDWPAFRSTVAEVLGPYFDVFGRFMERKGQTHEDRDATQGMALPVGPD